MAIHPIIFFICSGGAVGSAVYALLGQRDDKLYGRLRNERTASDEAPSSSRGSKVSSMVGRIGQAAASPFMPKDREKQTGLKKQLAMAGIYSPTAMRGVQGFKLICLVGGLGTGLVLGFTSGYLLLFGALGGLIGYLTPTVWLRGKINNNQRYLQLGLPDALDLMVVCVEAGLTVDAAMQRVEEIPTSRKK